MIDAAQRQQALETHLWDMLEAKGVGLLALTRSGLHPQPTMVFVDRRRRLLWLLVPRDTDLVRSLGDGGAAIFIAQGRGLLASISGNLAERRDARRIARLWTPAATDWRPLGPEDPGITLLRMECVDAEVSLYDAGMTRFAWDLARPRVRGKRPVAYAPTQPMLH